MEYNKGKETDTPMDNTISEVLSFVEENDVKFIRLTFCDLFGVHKNISIMPGELQRAFTSGVHFEQGMVDGYKEAEDPLFLVPDAGTVSILPWRPSQGRVIRFFCDVRHADGTPYEGCARSILKREISRAAQFGLSCRIGTECEFYLFKNDENGEPTMEPHDHAGYADIAPLDRGENVRREICLALEEMGFNPETSHHEAGPGQNEVDFHCSDALSAADNLLAFRAAVKAIANKNGLFASFMPKPFPDFSGSGMHINFSLTRGGKNIIHACDGMHDATSESFIEGVLTHIDEITAFFNPLTNSYSRFGAFDAPRRVGWSKRCNDSQLIRVPLALGDQARIELRSPDACCNPYLAFALLIEAGLEGVEKGMSLRPPVDGNEPDTDEADHLPDTLDEALEKALSSKLVRRVIPERTLESYYAAKQRECAACAAGNAQAFEHSHYFPFY